MSFTTIMLGEVTTIDTNYFTQAREIANKYPNVIQSQHEELQMAKALRTVYQLKNRKKDESK